MTSPPSPSSRSRRYAAWIIRRRWVILFVSMALAVGAGVVASTLPVFADFSYLLPPSAESVRHLRAIEKRARVIGTAMIAVESDDPVKRAAAAHKVRERVLALGPGLVSSVTFDESAARKYGWENRWLFVSLEDLKKGRDALDDEIRRAKLKANPLYVDFEDEPAKTADGKSGTDELRTRLKDAEAKKDDPGELVSKDGHLQMMVIRTAFSAGDVDKDKVLLAALDKVIAGVRAETPGVDIGVAGDISTSVAEHDSILNGMVLATGITVLLVLIALVLFYRSMIVVGALGWSLTVGTFATFAFTKIAIGHLNLATAFLSSIVVGNGINFGILFAARFMEEKRAGHSGEDALAGALAGTLHGTLAAALTAAVAYASLIITVFRGFRHFGVIGGVGILLCWISAFTVLPAALAIADGARLVKAHAEPPIGRVLERILPRRLGWVAGVTLALSCAAAVITVRYLTHDPFEANFRNLRSKSAAIEEEQRWMHKVDEGFGRGISGGFVIAVPTRAEAEPLIARLKQADVGKDEKHRLFSRVNSLDDLLPSDQVAKLAVLADIRTMLSGDNLENLSDKDRAEALKLRPPENLRVLGDDDVPEELAWPFIEADGSRGKIVLAMSGWGFELWDAHDIVRFADSVRGLDLGPHALLGGGAFVFADVLRSVQRDGPRATLASFLGAILVVLLVVGLRRHGVVTLICGVSGTLFMLAAGALLGLRVNFLDFVALPITIGIGIDYSVNIATRERQDGAGTARHALATAGSAVFLCSFTTIVGYGSLLLSQNKGIRSFGSAAILGEATCLTAALALAPALLWVLAPAAARRAVKARMSGTG